MATTIMKLPTPPVVGITVEQVPVWGIETMHVKGGPRGHIVMGAEDNGDYLTWARTACGSLFSSLTKQTQVPSRICGKCRQRLKDIMPPSKEERNGNSE